MNDALHLHPGIIVSYLQPGVMDGFIFPLIFTDWHDCTEYTNEISPSIVPEYWSKACTEY